jgi:hypothetical protein
MTKLVHQGSKSVDIVEIQEASIEQENLQPYPAVPFLGKFTIGYHNLSALTHMRNHESEKQETVQQPSQTVCTSGPKDVLWFSNGTKDVICVNAVSTRSRHHIPDQPLKRSRGQVMVLVSGR